MGALVWAEGGRKHPCQAGCYGSVKGAASGYGISRWSLLNSACGGKKIFMHTSQPSALVQVACDTTKRSTRLNVA